MRGHIIEGIERTHLALGLPGAGEDAELRADALEAAGGLAYWRGDVAETRHWYEQALEASSGETRTRSPKRSTTSPSRSATSSRTSKQRI